MQVGAPRPLWKHMDWPEGTAQANNTITYTLWFPLTARIESIYVMMSGVNTQGTYLLTVTNTGTAGSVLAGATFDMNTLVLDTITNVPLGTDTNRLMSANTRMTLDLVSNDAAFDGTGIYLAVFASEY